MTEDVQLARASALIEIGRWAEAERLLSQVLARQPGSAEVWCLLALSRGGAGRVQDALKAAREAVRCDPDDEWALRVLATQLRAAGHTAEAIEVAARAVAAAPDEWRAHITQAQALIDRPNPETLSAARAAVDRALELAPEEASVHLVDGNVADASGDYRRSRRAWRKALELDPADHAAVHNNALDELQRGRPLAAIRGFADAAALAPEDRDHPEYAGLAVDAVLWRLARRYVLIAVATGVVLLHPTVYGWRHLLCAAALLGMVGVTAFTLWRLPPWARLAILRRRHLEGTSTALFVIAIQPAFVAVIGYGEPLLDRLTESWRGWLLVLTSIVTLALTWLSAAISSLTSRRRPTIEILIRLLRLGRRDR